MAVVGIDIGGTKTHLRLLGPDLARDEIVPTARWRSREWHADATALLRLVRELCEGTPITAMAVGAHGCDDAAECEAFEAAFAPISPFPVRVVNDAELMPAALGHPGEIGLVAGTGSIAVCRTPSGEMLVAGGWGWIIGDEGSAASLVREAAKAVARHLDEGGARDEPLAAALFEALDIPSPARIGSRLGQIGGAAVAGSFAPVVFAAEAAGSELAARVIREGGGSLAELVARLDRRGAGASRVVAGGSVISSQPSLWRAFRDGLEQSCEGRIEPLLFTGAPVEGACRLAEHLARSEPDALFVRPRTANMTAKASS
ncbi:N-acetylglucosamine kinase [Jiella avicenniae]|uniref:Sugar kinase n=1 Tax=Jiella avicenniae TaxID=2907202 RepID=A0A9X1NY10_9HYPH|nr:BadF/BadG/BcrA/BcrD ATPase family protein [Jiella avicenniae]MCE7027697.1 sugar kinase [Jiella avicenniae]MCE7028739.1 sugar kinase [Jiella avicenniae]